MAQFELSKERLACSELQRQLQISRFNSSDNNGSGAAPNFLSPQKQVPAKKQNPFAMVANLMISDTPQGIDLIASQPSEQIKVREEKKEEVNFFDF